MEVLKWLAIATLSLAGAYFGHKLTGDWTGAAAAGVGVALILSMLVNGQWTMAGVFLLLGVYLVFTALGEGPRRADKAAVQTQAVPAGTVQEAKRALLGLMGGAKGDTPSPKPDTVASAPHQDAPSPVPQSVAGSAGGNTIKDCADCPQLVVIPAGHFFMGSDPKKTPSQETIDAREGPLHRVAVRSFAAGRYAVTKAEFAAFVRATQFKTEAETSGGCFAWAANRWESNHSFNWHQLGFEQGDGHPVVCISWNDAQAYVRWLSQVSHQSYRLLSEAEREYATRAGSTTTFWWGDSLSADRANYDHDAPDYRGSHHGTGRHATVPVDSFSANAFGLYNVHGNVWEWVQDCQHETYAGAPADGSPWVAKCNTDKRGLRGGAWVGDPAGMRSASRNWLTPDFRFDASGFRVARNVGKQN
jgi:formylglycine-generating enzyme required for sulfatase activity